VPGQIGPIPLQRLATETSIPVAELPLYEQQKLDDSILVESEEQANATVAELDAKAQACRSEAPPAGCPVLEPVVEPAVEPTEPAEVP